MKRLPLSFILTLFTSSVSAENKPNVLLFYADDMGYGEIQRFHPEASKVPTPHLNKLCDEGMMFTDAHTSSAVCTPSRYSLLTGRYNWRSTHQSGVTQGGKPCIIAEDRVTLPKLFKQQGYRTSMFGKWHLDFQYDRPKGVKAPKYVRNRWNYGEPIGTKIIGGPITRGFDYFYGFHHSRTMSSLITNDEVTEYADCINTMERLTDGVIKYLKDYAKEETDEPFFLYYPMNSPHAPVIPAEEWKGKGGLEGDYPAFVAQTDDHIGQVLKALEENKLSDNTVIIFGTDNGCHQQPSKFLDKGHSVSGPFRDKKASLHDGGHRIPFIIKWNGVVEPGTRTDHLICMTDIFSTFAEHFSYDIADNTAEDSISFLPVLSGKPPKVTREDIVHHDFRGRFAVRKGDWKLILHPDPRVPGKKKEGKEAEFQLYNMAADISESENLANEHPEKVDTLLTLLKEIIADGRSTPGKAQPNDTEIILFKKGS